MFNGGRKTPKSVLSPNNEQYYEYYRRGLIERHIASNGCFLGVIWLVEKLKNSTEGMFSNNTRDSEENFVGSSELYNYVSYPVLVEKKDNSKEYLLPGGGDNPLLYGGLAMATFCMENLKDLSKYSFKYAKRILDFFLLCEYINEQGDRTGYLLRKRHYWHKRKHASTDELCGVLLGLHFYIKSAQYHNDIQEENKAKDLLRRIANYLKENDYFYKPPAELDIPFKSDTACVFVFQFAFTRVFKEHLGESYTSDKVIPEDYVGEEGDVFPTILSLITIGIHYTQKDLFKDVIKVLPSVYSLSRKNFYNCTMSAYALLMVLLPDIVSDDVKDEIGRSGEEFFLELCRYPETFAYENAFFGVVAKLCRKFKITSIRDKIGNAISKMPFVDHICRGIYFRENQCREVTDYLLGKGGKKGKCVKKYEVEVKKCDKYKEESYQECDKYKDEGYYECNEWDKKCCTWWPSVHGHVNSSLGFV